jgi:hypothetical protein
LARLEHRAKLAARILETALELEDRDAAYVGANRQERQEGEEDSSYELGRHGGVRARKRSATANPETTAEARACKAFISVRECAGPPWRTRRESNPRDQ